MGEIAIWSAIVALLHGQIAVGTYQRNEIALMFMIPALLVTKFH